MVGEKILVVEDERIVARDIEKRLKKLGYVVVASVASSEEAIQKTAEMNPDLVLMDIQIRGEKDGIETAENIRTDFDIPVIYLTAYADEDTLQRAKVTEPFGYIIKPFDERDLYVAIEVALRRRLAEIAVRIALKKEKELSELKSRFWSMVVHEFRNPLTSILSSAQLLEQHGHSLEEERRREYLYLIQNSIRSLDRLLNDVLSVSQAERGMLEFDPEPLELEQFCQELIEEMRFSTGFSHQIVLNIQGTCTDICLDRKLLWHILTNLLSNAIKYSPQSNAIYLELTCISEEVIFKVKDSGIGIPKAHQRYLFQPFQRAENVGHIPGTGLGLAMVKNCLEIHNGRIDVDSEVGRGTTVTVRLLSDCRVPYQL